MPQQRYIPKDELALLEIWTPWTKGSKINEKGTFEPVFKENTPQDVIDKYNEYHYLISIRYMDKR